MRRHPEHELQKTVAAYLGWSLPPTAWFTSIGHGLWYGDDDIAVGTRGMSRRMMRGIRAKEAGIKDGVPDVLIVYEGRAHHIELKTARGTLTEAQRRTMPLLEKAGAKVAVARSLEDVQALLALWGIPTREVKPPAPILRALAAVLLRPSAGEPDL